MSVAEGMMASGLAALAVSHPEVVAILKNITPAARPIRGDDGPLVNLDLGGSLLYPEPADVWCERQLAEWSADPDRLSAADPATARPSQVICQFLPLVESWLADRVDEELPRRPVADVGFAFVFGIGLGHHLPRLVEKNLARNLVLVEPVAEFLLHSLFSIDWRDLLQKADAAGITIHLLVGLNPEETMRGIERIIVRDRGAVFIDGSYALVHYASWATHQARLLLNQRIGNFLMRPGTLDDEILMMRNAYGNLGGMAFHHVDFRERPDPGMPVFVIGSGPSLDRDLLAIKKWRDRAIVVSCGTALGILLRHGIRPDIHVENENIPPLVRNLTEFRDQYGLDGIRLAASVTVDPGAGRLFSHHWLYHRASTSPAILLNDKSNALPLTSPMVCNAALALAAAVGFRRLFLFGVDCGRRPGGAHHAKDTIYMRPDYDNFIQGENAVTMEERYARRVPGNFGGEIETTAHMDLSRHVIGQLLRHTGASCINCSDGATIEGAKPKAAAALAFDDPPGRQEETLAAIESGMKRFSPGEFLNAIDLSPYLAACDQLARGIETLSREGEANFPDLTRRLGLFREENGKMLEGPLKLVNGSLELMLRIGAYRAARIKDEKQRREFYRFFIEEFVRAGTGLAEAARELLQMINDRQPPDDIIDRFGDRFPLCRHKT